MFKTLCSPCAGLHYTHSLQRSLTRKVTQIWQYLHTTRRSVSGPITKSPLCVCCVSLIATSGGSGRFRGWCQVTRPPVWDARTLAQWRLILIQSLTLLDIILKGYFTMIPEVTSTVKFRLK